MATRPVTGSRREHGPAAGPQRAEPGWEPAGTPPEPAGRAIGPRARRATDVVLSLALANLRARYGRDRWRLLKWLLDPFLLVGVYLAFVALFLDRPGGAPGLSLACAVVPFQIVLMSVFNGLIATREHASIVLNMSFPRSVIPVAVAVTESIGFGASLALIVVMMAIYGVAPTLAVLWFPLVLAVTLLLAVAGAYLALLFGIWFPELLGFVGSFVRGLYFVAPGLVALADIPGNAAELVKINPLSGLFEGFRDVFLYGQSPAAWELLVPAAWAFFLLAVLVPVYRRESRHLAKVV
jgi:homopolymeric O-antigen transport system permease protein